MSFSMKKTWKKTWVLILAQTFTRYMTLNKSFNLSEPQSPNMEKSNNIPVL